MLDFRTYTIKIVFFLESVLLFSRLQKQNYLNLKIKSVERKNIMKNLKVVFFGTPDFAKRKFSNSSI